MRFPGEISVYQNRGMPGMSCRSATGGDGQIEDLQNLQLPTVPCSQLCMALTVCTWADDITWKRPQISCISCKTQYLHLQVPKHLKIPSITHKYQGRDCKHVFLPPLISSNETKFTTQPSPAPCRPALPRAVHALVTEDQTHFCNSN